MKQTINVLHLRDTDKICGPGKTILETITACDRDHFNLSIGLFMLEREGENAYFREALKRGIDIVPIRSSHQFSPWIIRETARIVRQKNIHIIHSHEYKSDFIALPIARAYGMPVITTLHGWIANNLKSKFYIAAQKKILRYFDAVIAVSDKTRRDILAAGVPGEKVKLIYNAIVTDKYTPSVSGESALKKRLNLSPSARLIGNIGRLSPEKGQKDFLRAAKKILSSRSDVYFVLAGDGPDRGALEELTDALGIRQNVFFLGHITDMRGLYNDVDAIALTSYTEGFPNVILEAMCMEKPVLATDVGGVSEIVQDQTTGILVQPADTDSICSGLLRLIGDRVFEERIVRNGKKLVLEKFEFRDRVVRVQDLYKLVYSKSGLSRKEAPGKF